MNLQRVTHIGQSIDAVVADGNYAYIGEGAGLRVLDVSNPANPLPLGRVSLLAFCKSVAKKGNYIYCGVLDKGLQVVDVSNPNLPQVVFTYEVSRTVDSGVWWSNVEVAGNRLYVSSGSGGSQSGIHAFDVTNPGTPSYLGHFPNVRKFPSGIAVKNDLVYVGISSSNGLQIIDFTNAGSPSEVGYFLPSPTFTVEDLVIDGDLAYTAASFQNGMVILDISDPSAPEIIGSYNTPNVAWNIKKFGNYVYVNDMWDNPGVLVLNVANPSNPTLATSLQVPGTAFKGIWIDQSRLYVTSLTHLSIFSLSNPASPTLLGSYSQRDQLGHPWGVRAKDGYLYVSDFRMGLKIFNIADPSNPMYLGKFRVSAEAEGVEVVGNAAYVCNVFGNGIETIDVSDKLNPTRTNILSLPQAGRVQNSVASGNFLYVAENNHGVYVVNISNPLTPTYETRFDTDGVAQDVAVVGNALFVADGNAGVKVLDLSNAPTLSLLTSITNIGNVVAVDVDGPRAIVGVRGPSAWEIRSYDISNVASPVFRDAMHSWAPFGIEISGNYALVQNHKAGVWAYDISDLSNLVKVSEFDTEGSADRGIDIDGEYIYSCDWLGGLNVFTVSGGLGAPTATPTPTVFPTVSPTPDLSHDKNTWLSDALQGSTHGIPTSVTMTQFGAAFQSANSSITYQGDLPIDQGSISFWLTLLEGHTNGLLFTDLPSTLLIQLAVQSIHFDYQSTQFAQKHKIVTSLPYAPQVKRRPFRVQVSWGPNGQRIYLNGELAAVNLEITHPRHSTGADSIFGIGRMPEIGGFQSSRNVLISNLVVSDNEIVEDWGGLSRPNFEPYPTVNSFTCDPPDAPAASILFMTGGNPANSIPGDAGMIDFLTASGHTIAAHNSAFVSIDAYEDYDLVIVSGSVGSTAVRNLHRSAVPSIIGEGAILSQNLLPSDMHMFFGNSNPRTGSQTFLNVANPFHPIAQGFGSPFQVYLNQSEAYLPLRQMDSAAPGTVSLLSPVGLPDYAAVALVEEGAILADGSRAPARRAMMHINEGPGTNRFGNLTPDGKELFRRLVNWALGEDWDCTDEPTPTPTFTSTELPPSETPTPTFTSTELPPSETPTATPIEGILGDLDRSGKVGPEDLLLFLQNWNKSVE